MAITMDVDVGGTFTDCFMVRDGQVVISKSPTTYYNYSVCFMKALEEGSEKLGLSLEEALQETEAIRYSTTIGTNAIIERTGPKLGLITTAGFEDTIYIGRARQWADGCSVQENKDLARLQKPAPLIARDMVVGVRERVDSFGNVIMPLDREDVLEKLQRLVDRGAMGFAVCLLWSFKNPAHEQQIRQIIEEEYPECYLGNMPVLLSSEISPKSGEYGRFMTTIVNAYMHKDLSTQTADLEEMLRDHGFRKPLTLVHNTGGMKKVSRTKAVYTHNAGPVAGIFGSRYIGQLYGMENIIFTDMGGTSFDIGIIAGGSVRSYDFIPVIDRWRTQVAAVESRSIGAGGGSIAWLNKTMGNRLEVGPQSAGAMPGPVAYNLGGTEPTVTDADIVLGYLNPRYYLGGSMRINKQKALSQIGSKMLFPVDPQRAVAAWFKGFNMAYFVGMNQYGEPLADVGAEMNAGGLGARPDMDGVHVAGAFFAALSDSGDVEAIEVDRPFMYPFRRFFQDSFGFGKFRGGAGLDYGLMVHHVPWLFMGGAGFGSKIPSTIGLFGGYAIPTFVAIKVKQNNLKEMYSKADPAIPFSTQELLEKNSVDGKVEVWPISCPGEVLMNGDVFIAAVGGGAGYGDVLERDPDLVMQDLKDGLISHWAAKNIYHISYDPVTLRFDAGETEKWRNAEREARKQRGLPFREFERRWSQKHPPAQVLRYYGNWPNPGIQKEG